MSNMPANPSPAPATPAATKPAHAGVSHVRFAIAMAVAVLADTVGVPFGEFGVVVFDVIVGLLLALCLRGFRPEIILACLVEAIPGIGLFPTWSLVVPAIWARMKLGASASAPPASDRESAGPR